MATRASPESHKGDIDLGPELKPPEAQRFKNDILGGVGVAPKPIVLFGESSNFTFTIALASLRASESDRITPPEYKITATAFKGMLDLPEFEEAKEEAEIQCTKNGKKLELSDEKIKENKAKVSQVSNFSNNWKIGINATKIMEEDIQVAGKVVWFQCPWIPSRLVTVPNERPKTTAELVEMYVQEMARHQQDGDTLVIGISTYEDLQRNYTQVYELKNILGDGSGEAVINEYRYLGHDENIIKKILARGYKHEGFGDIHDRIINSHLTLVFKREGKVSSVTQNMADSGSNA